jgi:large subunit ribosomal protein L4
MADTPKKETSTKPTQKEKKGYSIPVFDKTGKEKSTIKINTSFEVKESYKDILQRYIYVFLTNQRRGTAHTKTRAEVVGTTKKMYRQKGTGRARHGSEKAPIFVGGGVVGGPRKKTYHLSFSKKQKKIALLMTLAEKISAGKLICLENGIMKDDIKTKNAADLLKKLKLEKRTLLISPQEKQSNIYYSMRNIPSLTMTPIENLNPYILLHNQNVVIFEEHAEQLQDIMKTLS